MGHEEILDRLLQRISMSMYSATRRRLHWWVALLIAGQFLLQDSMRRAMERLDASNAIDVSGFLVTTWHSLAGLVIGILMVWRWVLRKRSARGPSSDTLSRRRARLADVHHRSMYAVVLLMVVSGLLNYYGDVPMSGRVHALGKWLLAALVAGHVLAAFWHHFVKQDNVLRNMIGSTRHADTIGDK